MNNFKIAAAVALALGGGVVSQSAFAAPTPAQCAAPAASLYVAGSSAAQPSFANALANDLFDSTGETTISAPSSATANGNFKAYCGFAKAGNGAGVATGAITTVFYRGEGGSVVGALPVYSSKPVKFLDLTGAGCAVAAPVVTGLSANVGTTDGWTGCVTSHLIEMGVTDVEPAQFKGTNYPSAYSATVFGSATSAQLSTLATRPLFQQVFGLFVNTSGINGGGTGQAIDLSKETAAAILSGAYSDWSAVPTATGGAVSSTSQAITIVNREAGSGSRTGASIYLLGTGCSPTGGTISDPTPRTDGYATGDVLATAATTPGAITYASIDNNGKQAALTMASINGVPPSNLAATSGKYDWWFEATSTQKGTIASPGGQGIYTWLTSGELSNVATAPHALDVLAIPGVGTNSGTVPATETASAVGGVTIYVNPFSKNGNSCSIAQPTNF
jgi:hypothetical protein